MVNKLVFVKLLHTNGCQAVQASLGLSCELFRNICACVSVSPDN